MKLKCSFLAFLTLLCIGSLISQEKLSEAEKAWLASKPEIVFVGQTSYPPFEFVHPKRGEYSGMAIELIRWIGTEYGFTPVFKPMPFSAAQQAVLIGTADAITGIFESEERKQRFDFTDEVFSVPASIFVKTERTDILEIENLQGKHIAVQRGDYAIEYLAAKKIQVEWIYTNDFPSALNLVANGEADALIGDEQIVLYYMFDGNLSQRIKKVADPLYTGKDCIAVARGNLMLASILQKGLTSAKEKGVLSSIYKKWLGITYVTEVGFLEKWALPLYITLGALLLAALMGSIWIFQLRIVVRKKTAQLTAVNADLYKSNESLLSANSQLVKDMEERAHLEEERRRLEARMVKTQNYESLALMAGGVAHDFNNLLTGIIGSLEIAIMSLEDNPSVVKGLREAINTAKQAGELARRMLDFSGRSALNMVDIDLVKLLGDMKPVIEATLPNRTPASFSLPDAVIKIKADPIQIRQIVMNLALNAAEASGNTGKSILIQVLSKNYGAEVLATARAGADVPPGRYAVIEVKDSGSGIEPRTLDRIFDPFFTTKKTGRGLGLAAIAGIIKSHQGCILVNSTPGSGSSFDVLFPLVDSESAAAETESSTESNSLPALHGKILVIDDEETVKKTTVLMLQSLGFSTIDAISCNEGIKRLKEVDGQVDAAVIDLNMPGKDGFDTYCEIRSLYPEIPVMISTGLNDISIQEKFEGRPLAGVLEKPFDRFKLAQSMQKAFPKLKSAKMD